jgi:hypothetical protein
MLISVVTMESSDAHSQQSWSFLGKRVPRSEIVFFCQVIIIYTVILTSIYNLSRRHEDGHLWTALLSSSLGYLLPNPTIKTEKKKLLPQPPAQ